MPTQNIIQRQNELLQRSYSIINDYERGKSEVEAHLKQNKESAESTWKRDKGAAEAAWKGDKETIEQNLSRTKSQADSIIKSVREVMKSSQDVLKGTKWRDKLIGWSTPTRSSTQLNRWQDQTDNSFIRQMDVYQSASKQAGRDIKSLLEDYKINMKGSIFVMLFVGIFCGMILFLILAYIFSMF